MNLKAVSVAAALAVATVSLVPASFAASTTTTTMTMAKPAPKAVSAPDPKRFKVEADAQKSCPSDTVVWVNLKSKIFHLPATATYGKGKTSVYMCETDAKAEKFKATKKPEKVLVTTTTTVTTTKGK
jgi:hypothetical protein